MNKKDLDEIMEVIGALAALRGDLQHVRDWEEFQMSRDTMLKHLKIAEDATERVALGIHRKGATVQ